MTAALDVCASCGLPERDHQASAADGELARIMMALAGCSGFRIAARQAHAVQRRPNRRAICRKCGQQGHVRDDCPW